MPPKILSDEIVRWNVAGNPVMPEKNEEMTDIDASSKDKTR